MTSNNNQSQSSSFLSKKLGIILAVVIAGLCLLGLLTLTLAWLVLWPNVGPADLIPIPIPAPESDIAPPVLPITAAIVTATNVTETGTVPVVQLNSSPAWFSPAASNSRQVVWGDVNGDGSLDMVVARSDRGLAIYLNEGGTMSRTPIGLPDNPTATRVALGDMDSDGDLDLVTAAGWPSPTPWYNRIYRNDISSRGAVTFTVAFTGFVGFNLADGQDMGDVALADMDRDGDLDMAVALVGSSGAPNRLYRNDGNGGVITMTEVWANDPAYNARSAALAWGDVNDDGYPDLAVGNIGRSNQIYLYDRDTQTLATIPAWEDGEDDWTSSIALGDLDGDGFLDLAVGNLGDRRYNRMVNKVYRNRGDHTGLFEAQPVWTDKAVEWTESVAWGDVDADGDLDLAVGNALGASNKIYLNQNNNLQSDPAWIDPTRREIKDLAWGDMDGDGDLDLAAAISGGQDLLFRNDGGILRRAASVTPPPPFTLPEGQYLIAQSLAWGDVDSDGDLDLAVGYATHDIKVADNSAVPSSRVIVEDCNFNYGPKPSLVYENNAGALEPSPGWSSADDSAAMSLAWGDVDGDGDLDLAVGNHTAGNKIYRNTGNGLEPIPFWTSSDTDRTMSLAWGDVDGDGDLDLVSGNCAGPNRLYRNENGLLKASNWAPAIQTDVTYSLAWGDVDGDGDLDLAVGNDGPDYLYLNQGGQLANTPAYEIGEVPADSRSVAWGDVDGDGDLDLAVGLFFDQKRIFENKDGRLQPRPLWLSADSDLTVSLAWGDADGDGDLDLAAGNVALFSGGAPNRIYLNDRGRLNSTANWHSGTTLNSWTVAWGDVNRDGLLDLAAANQNAPLELYLGQRPADPLAGEVTTSLNLGLKSDPVATFNGQSSTTLAPANFYAVPGLRAAGTIPFSYTLSNPTGAPVRFVRAYYSSDGGGRWFTARPTSGTITQNLATAPDPTPHLFTWDVLGSGFFGQSDNVIFRLEAYSGYTPTPGAVAGSYQQAVVSAQTYPFRVQGTQIQVLSGTQVISNALVYRLPGGEPSGGCPMGGSRDGCTPPDGTPFVTNARGFLQGQGRVEPGDRLLALAPVDWTRSITWATGLTGTMRLYYTNGAPTEVGVDALISNTDSLTVTRPGLQQLAVSPDHPLLLFDLYVSLEWDAHKDLPYLEQLKFDLQKASEHLYDFTNGQVALGRVIVFQNAEDWRFSEVVVQATNRLRPFAVQGGLVITPTVDPQHPDILYDTGQVRMGSTWNRYGNAGQNLGEDWSLTLAHELSHFLLFLDDTYLGLNEAGLLIAVDTQNPEQGCTGTAMGDVYTLDNSEFLVDEIYWNNRCAQTLTARTLQRTEWDTIRLWYPWLKAPAGNAAGPSRMPFDLTTVEIFAPLTPTNTLDDPTFFLDYGGREVSSAEARAFMLRNEDDNPDDFETVYDLGSPVGGQNRLLARGARPGDRLCVFDRPQGQFGCEMITFGDERLKLKVDPGWTPVIEISPVSSTTFDLQVSRLSPDIPALEARLYPEFGPPQEVITLTARASGNFSGTFDLADPALAGHVQLWVDEPATEDNPRREVMVGYSIGGSLARGPASRGGGPASRGGGPASRGGGPASRGGGPASRGGGPASRGGGPASRGGGPASRGGGAPLVSPDGQMIFFTENPGIFFTEGVLYTVQGMASLPPLPAERTALGPAYNLVATGTAAPQMPGSISFQYQGLDALVEQVEEETLQIHYWDGTNWRPLQTVCDPYYNFASASSQGPGVYTLLGGGAALCQGRGSNDYVNLTGGDQDGDDMQPPYYPPPVYWPRPPRWSPPPPPPWWRPPPPPWLR